VPLPFLLVVFALVGLTSPSLTAAQGTPDNAEARVYFEEGNRLYERANRVLGADRDALLQRSLEAYVDSLQIVRSRNALFNAAIVLGELGRHHESFNYLSEYLRIEGLSAKDRAEATRRRDALRDGVAVLRVITEPGGARLWLDRKDLAPVGETPIEVALPPGEHRIFAEKEGHEPIERTHELVRGQTVVVELSLSALAVEPPSPPSLAPPAPEAAERPRPRLRNAALGTAAGMLATAGVALGVSLRAGTLKDEYDRAAAEYRTTGDPEDFQRAQDLADRTDRFNLTADVLWGTTIALGVSAAVLYGVHRKRQKRERPEVGVSASRHGGFASVRMPLGAAR
jgi:hypothetical protein